MKLTWKNQSKNNKRPPISYNPSLPFNHDLETHSTSTSTSTKSNNEEQHKVDGRLKDDANLAEAFETQGNKLAEGGNYREALGKWEAALALMPERAVLYEQKAQVFLEIGEAWNALKAATIATELEPSWAEAWITLGRAQLNFGEPDSAIESLDRALAIKPDSAEARDDRQVALHLVKRRKQLHSSGFSDTKNRYVVGDKTESS